MTNEPMNKLQSKVVQIQAAAQHGSHNSGEHVQLYVLCEDGTVWVRYISSGGANVPETGEWFPVAHNVELTSSAPKEPQPKIKEIEK